jgi:hypothetical protein
MKTLTINIEDNQYKKVLNYLKDIPSIEIYELTKAGKELLQRKNLLESGKAKFLSEDEFFSNV